MCFDKCKHLCNPNAYQNTEHYRHPNLPVTPQIRAKIELLKWHVAQYQSLILWPLTHL